MAASEVPAHVQQAVETLLGHLAYSEIASHAATLNSEGKPKSEAIRASYQKHLEEQHASIQELMKSGNPALFLTGLPAILAAFDKWRDVAND